MVGTAVKETENSDTAAVNNVRHWISATVGASRTTTTALCITYATWVRWHFRPVFTPISWQFS